MLFINVSMIEFAVAKCEIIEPVTVLGYVDWEVDFKIKSEPKSENGFFVIKIEVNLESRQAIPKIHIDCISRFHIIPLTLDLDAKTESEYHEYAKLITSVIEVINSEILEKNDALRSNKILLSVENIAKKIEIGKGLSDN